MVERLEHGFTCHAVWWSLGCFVWCPDQQAASSLATNCRASSKQSRLAGTSKLKLWIFTRSYLIGMPSSWKGSHCGLDLHKFLSGILALWLQITIPKWKSKAFTVAPRDGISSISTSTRETHRLSFDACTQRAWPLRCHLATGDLGGSSALPAYARQRPRRKAPATCADGAGSPGRGVGAAGAGHDDGTTWGGKSYNESCAGWLLRAFFLKVRLWSVVEILCFLLKMV